MEGNNAFIKDKDLILVPSTFVPVFQYPLGGSSFDPSTAN